MNKFGYLIRKYREDAGIQLRKVAAHLDIDQAILSKIERGQRKAKREQVAKLADFFKVDKEELLVAWLSDKVLYEVQDDELALKAIMVAEKEVAYGSSKKVNSKEIITQLQNYFTMEGKVSKTWLFGSFARGDDDEKSDIDLMISVPEDVSFTLFDLAGIRHDLEELTARKVDIVMEHGVRSHIMERIKPDLKVIYER